jgi:hypothetical protein
VTGDVRHGPDSIGYRAEPESVSVEISHGLHDEYLAELGSLGDIVRANAEDE